MRSKKELEMRSRIVFLSLTLLSLVGPFITLSVSLSNTTVTGDPCPEGPNRRAMLEMIQQARNNPERLRVACERANQMRCNFAECAQFLVSTDSRSCEQLFRSQREAMDRLAELCRKVGSTPGNLESGNQCLEKLEQCEDIDADEGVVSGIDTVSRSITSALGGAALPVADFQSHCRPLSREDRRRLESRKERLEERIERLAEEMEKIQSDAEKKRIDIQKQINELDRRFREDSRRGRDEERADAADFLKAQMEASQKAREVQRQILQAQLEQGRLIRQRAEELVRLSRSAIQMACMDEMNKVMQQMAEKDPTIYKGARVGSTSGLIAQNDIRRNQRNERLRLCIQQLLQRRESVRQSYHDKQQELESRVSDLQASLEEIRKSLEAASQQRQQRIEESKREQQEKTMEYQRERMALLQEAQQAIESAQRRIQQNQQNLQRLRMELARVSNDLATADSRPEEAVLPDQVRSVSEEVLAIRARLRQNNCVPGSRSGSGVQGTQ